MVSIDTSPMQRYASHEATVPRNEKNFAPKIRATTRRRNARTTLLELLPIVLKEANAALTGDVCSCSLIIPRLQGLQFTPHAGRNGGSIR